MAKKQPNLPQCALDSLGEIIFMLNKEMILKNVALSYVINSYNIDSTVILLEHIKCSKYMFGNIKMSLLS